MSSSSKNVKENQEFKMPPKHKFQEGEKVLCYHGPLIYEAKCLHHRYDEKDKTFQYHIHYSGWNKSWDEWVPEVRVLKFNEGNLQKQSDLKKAQKAETKGKKKRSTTGKERKDDNEGSDSQGLPLGTYSSDDRAKKRRIKTESDEGEQVSSNIKIKLTENLKDILADDWSFVTLENKVAKLPPSMSIDDIFEEYLRVKEEEVIDDHNKLATHKEILDGLRDYFNVMLSSQLLYDSEQEQFENVISKYGEEISLTGIYGAIHLLRMFARLGWALSYSRFDDFSIELILSYINEFVIFLNSKSTVYFGAEHYVFEEEDDD